MADQAFYDPSQDNPAQTPPTTGGSDTASVTPAPTASSGDVSLPNDTAATTDAAATGTANNATGPAGLTGFTANMSPSDYSAWYSSMVNAGYSPTQITQYKSSVLGRAPIQDTTQTGTRGGNFYGSPPYPPNYGGSDPNTGYVGGNQGYAGQGTPDATGVIGEDLGNWQPGQVYTGTGNTSGDFLMTDETFTPKMSSTDSADTTPVNWNVTADQTVQGQMNSIVGNMQSSPIYQSLADSLTRAQAAHGGENSLMAETAAYNGVVNLAFQVASADAATYAKSAEFNASTANQFSMANLQFKQQALLSTQNYQQSQVLQSQQIQGNLQSVSMQIAGQIRSTEIGANAQVASAQIGAAAQRAAASISAGAALAAAHIQQQTALESIQANFESNWTLNEQTQGHQLELNDRQTDNTIRANIVQSNSQFGQAVTIQHNADQNANLRQLMGDVTQIGATPGLTGDQQAQGVKTVTDIYHTNASLTSGFYSSSTYSLANGTAGSNIAQGSNDAYASGGGPSGAMQGRGQTAYGSSGTPGGPIATTPSYDQYGDYLSYGHGGYTMVAPPVDPFYGGTGLPTSQGGIPLYGSNLDYENSTGNTVGYSNELTGTNPVGNAPNTVTGGANYTGNDFLPDYGVGGGGG